MESATSSRPPASPPVWLTVFASLTGNLFLVVGTTILSVLSILVSWIPPRGNAVFLVGRLWARALLAASCLRVDVIREAELDPRGSYVFLSNHQSLFDIPVLFATVPGQTRMMAKRSLFRIPVFGWAIATGGFIPIDRGDRSTARHSFAAAIGKLRRGTSVLLFPEGTRALADPLLPFPRG